MRRILISLVLAFILISCNQSVWIEEVGDDFKEKIEEHFATTEVVVMNNGIQSIVEVAFSAKENGSLLEPEAELEDGYYLFNVDDSSSLCFSISSLPSTFSVIWKDDFGNELVKGLEYETAAPEVEQSVHVLILNEEGGAENAVKFRVRNKEVAL